MTSHVRNPWKRPQVLARRRALLLAIAGHWASKRYGPSTRDLSEATGIPSPAVVSYHLARLSEADFITLTPGVSRSARPTPLGWYLASFAGIFPPAWEVK